MRVRTGFEGDFNPPMRAGGTDVRIKIPEFSSCDCKWPILTRGGDVERM
ncbi:MAG: hypothetical protein ACYS30_02605 [Planctomycetota bacterium]|jgi:hypothetical protein